MKNLDQKIVAALGDLVIFSEGPSPIRPPKVVTNDSRQASKKTVFVAIRGSNSDGHSFIKSAILAGSTVIVCEELPQASPDNILFIKVSNSYSAYAKLAELFYDYPSKKLILTGITGTNGKTTTAYILKSILETQDAKCGLISTVEYNTGKTIITAERTTPDAVELQKLFAAMNNAACRHVVMEVSSHSLDQNRIGSAKFAVGIFSNISGDHLDYHKSMDAYFDAKKTLFAEHIEENGYSVINIDDPTGQRLYTSVSENSQTYSYGTAKNADFCITDIVLSINKTEFSLSLPTGDMLAIKSPLCGRFNTYNIAAAATAAYLLKIEISDILAGIAKMNAVPGRMEKCSDSPLVFVDYAHTDDALRNVLSTISGLLENRKLTIVFGCGGDRDRTKRPRMGAVAAKFADKIIITSDNPRTENPDTIIDEIASGIPDNINFSIIQDRAEAIKIAISEADSDTVILIAGKGHEDYQEINGTRFPFDDRGIVCHCVSAGD